MDSEAPQTMEDLPTNADDKINKSESSQTEAVAAETADGGGHEDKSDSDAAAEIEKDIGDSATTATAAAVTDDTKEPEGEEGDKEDEEGEGGSSPQAERHSEETKKDEDTSESDTHQRVQSESETVEKIPLDEAEFDEEKKEVLLQHQVRFDVSGDSSTEGAGEETKDDPTAVAATDTEQGLGTPTKLPLPSTESERGKEPVWYSHTSLLITSVFSIFCFFPMGIVALYYAMKVKDTYLSKNEATKIKDYARRSTFCSVAAIITGIVALLLILMVIILGITGVVGAG